MLKSTRLPLGVYQTNCYIIHEENASTCCVLDPGGEAKKVLELLANRGLTLEAILLTHGHFDHVGAVKELHDATGCRVYLCTEDLTMPAKWTAGELFYTDAYGEGDQLDLAGLHIQVLHTPGHTPGSVCLLVDDTIFSGDTLFAGSCGRTDLPGGDTDKLLASLGRLDVLEGDYTVCPGHSASTTLAREKQYNPFIKKARAL